MARDDPKMDEISRRILCVDDEPNVLASLHRQLRKQFDVTTAVGVREGLERLRTGGPFAVVLADYNMPGMNGVEFLREVRRLSPDTVTAVLTGRGDLDVAVSALHEAGIFRFLTKPCPRERLEQALTECLDYYRLVVSERRLTAALNDANEKLRHLNQDLERRVQERTAEIRRLHGFVSELNGVDRVEDVANLTVATAAEMLASRRVSVMLPDDSGEYLTVAAAIGMPEPLRARVRVPTGSPLAGLAFARSQTIVVNEPGELARYGRRYDSEFFAVVPLVSTSLVAAGNPVGVLNVTERNGPGGYGPESLATLKAIADAAAIAIQNQIRLRQRNEARDATILALARLAEHRDPETGAHLERVQVYCRLLSETLAETARYAQGIDPAFIDTIVRSSPLHDIGKVGIPDAILLKPGKLTAAEFETMKTHTLIGGDTLRGVLEKSRGQSFLQMGMEIAYHHHEKFDGSGYPRGLTGEHIPLSARIVALADVYDALTTRRVYKPAFSHPEAVECIAQGSGVHFDPAVVHAFRERQDEFAQSARKFRDDSSVQDRVDQARRVPLCTTPAATP